MFKNVCLIGTPNCGKTTLYNLLTDSYEKVGNRSGVTVEQKSGKLKKDPSVTVTDLPGLYSLSADSEDERAVIKFIKNQKPDVIINVIDGVNPVKGLTLSAELTELSIPTVIAVNFCDELEKNGVHFNAEKLSEIFGVPVVKISARKKINIDALILTATKDAAVPKRKNAKNADLKRAVLSLKEERKTRSEIFTDKADKILLSKIWGFPIMFAVCFSMFFLTLRIGGRLGGVIGNVIDNLGDKLYLYFTRKQSGLWFADLTCNAVIGGVGNVLGFLPQIVILFFFLTALEQTGYTSRMAFLTDEILSKVGLCGKSVFSLGLSCGCAVSGEMAVASIEEKSSREMTAIVTPFMPCGAKTAVFAYLCGKIFDGNALIAATFYIVGVFMAAISGKILLRFKRFKTYDGFIIELPTLRTPSLRVLYGAVRDKIRDFLLRAGSVIFAVSVILWALKSFGFSGFVGENIENSFLYAAGNILKYLFYPLGFGNWQASVSLISGIFAKEAVIESFNAVTIDPSSLFYSAYSAYGFMVFILVSPPCVAALAAAKKELKSKKLFFGMLVFQFAAGYIAALIINLFGLIAVNMGEIPAFVLTLTAALTIICLKNIFVSHKCGDCSRCKTPRKNCRTAQKAN